MMDLSNVPVTLAGVIAVLPVAGIIWGAARISNGLTNLTSELREFKESVSKKMELHDLTINTHSLKIGVLETRAETTHERMERLEKTKP